MPGEIIQTSNLTLDGGVAVDYDLIRITTGGNCLNIRDVWGRIGRIELTNTSGSGDCLIVGNKVNTNRLDIGIPRVGYAGKGGGFVWQQTKLGTSHNDGWQCRGGTNVHLWDVAFVGPNYESGLNSSQGVLFKNSGQGFPNPANNVCHRCVWCGRFTNPVDWDPSEGTGNGIDQCYVIGSANQGYTSGALLGSSLAGIVNTGNTINTGQNHPQVAYAYANHETMAIGQGGSTGGGTFSRTASREIIVVRSSLKALTKTRSVTRDRSEAHTVTLSGGGTDINRPRQADRLADVIRARTVESAPSRSVTRLPDVTRSYEVGQVIYRQWAVPWTSTEANPSCTVTIVDGNRVQAFTFQATSGDVARAIQSGSQYMPGAYIKGRLRFRFTQKQNLYGQAQGIFGMRVAAGSSPFRLQFDNVGDRLTAVLPRMSGGANHLTVSDILGSSPVVGQTYLVEWKLDRSTTGLQFYELKVDGVVIATGTPPAASTLDVIANFFEGFTDATNVNGVALGVTVEVWDLVLATADVPLPPEDLGGGTVTGEGSTVPEAVLSGQGYLVGTGSI